MTRRLPPRPHRIALSAPDAPFRFVTLELADELGMGVYALLYALADAFAWLDRPDRTRALVTSKRETASHHAENTGEISPLIRVLYQFLHEEPDEYRTHGISVACVQLAAWAEARGAVRTAAAFAQVASEASPEDTDAAALLGRLARRAGYEAEGLLWLRWARGAAHRLRDAPAFARASLLLGYAHYERGESGRAAERLLTASKAATEAADRETEADASAALALLLYEEGQDSLAASFAVEAVTAYGRRNVLLHDFAADLVWTWTGRGFYRPAARLCAGLTPRVQDPERRALVLALQSRAAAATDDNESHERAWSLAWEALGAVPAAPSRALVLLHLARAADTRGHVGRATTTAAMALEAAHAARQARWARDARDIVDVLTSVRTDDESAITAFPDRRYAGREGAPPPSAEEDQEEVATLLLLLLSPEPEPGIPSPVRRALASGRDP